MRTKSSCIVLAFLLLFSVAGSGVFGQVGRPLSKVEVLTLLPRGIDMDGVNDQANYDKLVSQGPQTFEVLGEELLVVSDWITAGRIIAIFVESTGDKAIALKYLKRFVELPRADAWWKPVQTQAAEAIRKFEETQSVPTPIPKEGDEREAMLPTPSPKVPETKPTPSPTSEEPTASTPWSVIVVLIVAALGLLWILLKRRS